MSPILEEVPESFETERLLIRSPREGDGRWVNQAVAESLEQFKRWLPWAQTLPTVEQSEANAREARADYLTRKDLRLLFFLKETGVLVGSSGLHRIDWRARRFEIGYWCRTSMQGRGYITEGVSGLTDLAFEKLRANRVEIHCSHRNVASARVAERAGFRLEATLRDHSVEPSGELRDTLMFALTRREWEAR